MLEHEIQDTPRVDIKLVFKLQTPTALEDIHINILPFVMETSSIRGERTFCVSISYASPEGTGTELVQIHISFQDVRFNVAEALMDFIKTTPRGAKADLP